MSTKKEVVLGENYSDPITGIKGTAVAILYHLDGTVRISLQAKIKRGQKKSPPQEWHTEHLLLGLKEPVKRSIPIALGQKVTEITTGFTGIAILAIDHHHGCIRYEIKAKGTDADGKSLEAEVADLPDLIYATGPNKGKPVIHEFSVVPGGTVPKEHEKRKYGPRSRVATFSNSKM